MAYQPETGFATKIYRFGQLVLLCQSFGGRYAPIHPVLQLSYLQQVQQRADASLQACATALNHYQQKVSDRQTAYKRLDTIPTLMMSVLKSNFADKNSLSRANSYVKKLRGQRISPLADQPTPNDPNAAPKKTRSVSQRSYSNRAQHFASFLDLLSTEPAYQTTEPSLQLRQLQTQLNQLNQANADVTTAEQALTSSRSLRDGFFNDSSDNLSDIAQAIKNYLASAFGKTSDEYRQAAAIKL